MLHPMSRYGCRALSFLNCGLALLSAACIAALPLPARAQAAAGVTFTLLHSFDGSAGEGTSPRADLTLGSDGDYYGTTEGGGANNSGSVFKMTPDGVLTTLHPFATYSTNQANADGAEPYGGLVQASNGSFYGTTSGGGGSGGGTVYEISPSGAFATLYAFGGANENGSSPMGALIVGGDGNLYGATSEGGAGGYGTVFQINVATGALTTIYSISGTQATGIGPRGRLTVGSGGTLYGTVALGGANQNGEIFALSSSDAASDIHDMSADGSYNALANTDGAQVDAGVTFGPDGALYGTASQQGPNGSGTIYRVTTSGAYSVLQSFHYTNGSTPEGDLLLGPDGNFYGTTVSGGSGGNGTVFRITPAGALTTLYSFSAYNGSVNFGNGDGAHPESGLILGADDNLYGTCETGVYGNGSVFKIAVSGLGVSASLSSLALSSTVVVGGQSSIGTVTLSSAAPTGGASVTLASGNTALATVPSGVTVAAGGTTANFTITTAKDTAATQLLIYAAYGTVQKTAALTVAPAYSVASLTLNPTSVVGGAANSDATGTVTLSQGAPALGATVFLASSNTNALVVPRSVSIAAGAATATFVAASRVVSATVNVTITATYNSSAQLAVETVTKIASTTPALSSLSLSQTSVAGGTPSQGKVQLTVPAPNGGIVVSLSSSASALASVPASVTVNAGASSATFAIATSAAAFSTPAIITASYSGVVQTATLTITPASTRFDFNKDDHADLIWYNTGSGAVSVWDMDDQSVLQYGATFTQLAPSSGWMPVAAPDVNDDGYPDLMWWNKNTGEMSIWTLQNTTVTNFGGDFATLSDTTWKPVAAADVTGTTWELVFQNSASGDISLWQMNGTTVEQYGGVLGSVGSGTGWQVVGAPDLNGDGKSDLLFWNSQTGEVAWWGCNLANQQVLSYNGDFAQVGDTSWRLVGSEDTNGDGHPDLIWWNANSGSESRWLLDGTTVTQYGGGDTQVSDTTWQPTAIR